VFDGPVTVNNISSVKNMKLTADTEHHLKHYG